MQGSNVITNSEYVDISTLAPCSHEEADTGMMVHAAQAIKCGYEKIIIRTVDSDVVILCIALYHKLKIEELWIDFGVGNSQRLVAIHDVAQQLGNEKSLALPMFHALTGCDTTSSFFHFGKTSAWEAWNAYPDLTVALLALSDPPCSPNTVKDIIERFIVILYDRTRDLTCINEARKEMFCSKDRALDKIPPTKGAFEQHLLRSVYQGCFIWGQILEKLPNIPDASDWGWVLVNNQWQPHWTNMPKVQDVCIELIKCGCKSGCKNNTCKCKKYNVPCILRCGCKGECQNNATQD